jgi:hypothetical protein
MTVLTLNTLIVLLTLTQFFIGLCMLYNRTGKDDFAGKRCRVENGGGGRGR